VERAAFAWLQQDRGYSTRQSLKRGAFHRSACSDTLSLSGRPAPGTAYIKSSVITITSAAGPARGRFAGIDKAQIR